MNKQITKIFFGVSTLLVTPIALVTTSCNNNVKTIDQWPPFSSTQNFSTFSEFGLVLINGIGSSFNDKILSIPPTINGLKVSGINLPAADPITWKQNIEEIWFPNKVDATHTFYIEQNVFQNMPNLKKVVYGSATRGMFTEKTWNKVGDGGLWTDEEFNVFAPAGFDIYYNWIIEDSDKFTTEFIRNSWAPYGSKLNNIFILNDEKNISKSEWVQIANNALAPETKFPNKGWTEDKIHYVKFKI